jgi:iron complex outermembrane receptor protein
MKLKKITQTMLAIGLIQAVALVAHAQEVTTKQEDPAKKVEKVQKVEVIGTNIKRTTAETSSPIQVIKAEDIMRSGAANLTELMQTITAITSGGQNDLTSGNGFASGTATNSLRGLGSSSTLTLINGRRMAATATADPNSGQSTLYNINSIPMAAIERVEVLLDGASAIYGSDAMSGVVNYVLKKEFKGLEARMSFSGADQGDFVTQSANIFGGFGDYEDNGYNIMYGVSLLNRPETPITRTRGLNLAQIERLQLGGKITDPDSAITFTPNYWAESKAGSGIFSTTSPVSPKCPTDQLSTTWLSSKVPTCVMDLSPWSTFTSQSKQANAFAKASFKINDNVTGSIELAGSRLENAYGPGFATIGSGLSTWFDPEGKRRSFRHIMAANHPDNPLFQANSANQLRVTTSARLGDIATGTDVVNTSYRLVGDLRGTHFGWDWQAGLLHNSTERQEKMRGMINSVTAQAALDKYRFGGVNDPSLLSQISPDALTISNTEVNILDLKGSTEFGKLPGGAVGVAAGAEFRQESIGFIADKNLDAGNFVGRGSSKADGKREVASIFAEFNIPVIKSFEISLAGRLDNYSDYGNSKTPKVGFKWTPHDMVSFRATVAEGFRAPGLPQISSSSVSSFQSIPTWRDTVRCPLNASGVNAPIPGVTGYDNSNECNRLSSSSSRSISSFIIANTKLQPETSKSTTFGIVFAPTKSFDGTIDFYEIRRKNEIDRYSSGDILEKFFQNGETEYANVIFRSPDINSALKDAKGNPIPGTEPIVGVKRQYKNLGETRTKGADLTMAYRMNLAEMGRLNANLSASFMTGYKQSRDKNLPLVDYSDTGTLPKQKVRLSVTWIKGAVSTFVAANHVGDYALPRTNSLTGVRDTCHPSIASNSGYMAIVGSDCRVSSWTTFDVGMTYRGFKNTTLSATIRNLVGKTTPFDPNYTYNNSTLHNMQGRTFSLNASYKFY